MIIPKNNPIMIDSVGNPGMSISSPTIYSILSDSLVKPSVSVDET